MATSYSPARCQELFCRYSREPSLALRNKLVQMNMGLVRKVAHQLKGQNLEPYEDLEQVGYLGLILAIERFSPSQGTAFSSFAVPYIRGEILHYLRDKSTVLRIPRRFQERYSKGKTLQKKLTLTLGRAANEEEVAQALGISLAEWQDCLSIGQHRFLVSLDAPLGIRQDCSSTLVDILPDVRGQAKQSQEEERSHLQVALRQLGERTQAAIEYVFLRELPRKEAARELGINPMTVTRHLHKGLVELETLLRLQFA